MGFKAYRDGHIQKLESDHKVARVKFALQMSRWIHEMGRDKCWDDVWHSDEKIFVLQWNSQNG